MVINLCDSEYSISSFVEAVDSVNRTYRNSKLEIQVVGFNRLGLSRGNSGTRYRRRFILHPWQIEQEHFEGEARVDVPVDQFDGFFKSLEDMEDDLQV